jgi:nitrogen regulatory protein PII
VVQGMTVSEAKGFGPQKSNRENYRSAEYTNAYLPKLEIELYVTDSRVQRVIETIARVAKTGSVGDGEIFVMDLDSVMRIRTGETGESAL